MTMISRVRHRRETAAFAALALAGAGFAAAVAAPAQAASACAVTYKVTNAWPGGFLADVAVTNQGSAVSPTWVLTWSWASGQSVVGGWNATFAQSGATVTATGSGALESGATASFGFQGNADGSPTAPTSFALNGQTCGGAIGTSSTSTSGTSGNTSSSTKTSKTTATKTSRTKTKKTKTRTKTKTKTTTTKTTKTTKTSTTSTTRPPTTSTTIPTTTTKTSTTTTSTTTTSTSTSTGPTGPSTTWPSAAGNVNVTSTISVSGTFDGGLKRYYGLGDGGQSESQPAIFTLADGATLKNVIIGTPAGDGIHCMGTCTLTNVWWEDVGEDAATFKGTTSTQTMTVNGGGARYASDKVFQHNGPGTFVIKNFYVDDFGKLYRACGNCSSSYKRDVIIDNVIARAPGYAIVGINTNFGDTAKITRLTILDDSSRKIHVCAKYKGVAKGSEPTYLGDGADGTNCLYSSSDVTYR